LNRREDVRSPQHDFQLIDVTSESGVNAIYQNGREAGENSILELIGGGVGILDFDRDSALDIFLPGGGTIAPNKEIRSAQSSLWRGDGKLHFTETSAPAGIAESRYYSHGCAAADIDSDGFTDLLVTGYGGLQLFLNCGDGTFVEDAIGSGLSESTWSSSAAFGDFNGDGHVDLYVAHYVNWSWDNHPTCPSSKPGVNDLCGPRDFDPLDDAIYYSNGDGTFRDATHEAGLVAGGNGLGVIAADFDRDRDIDIYVANDMTNNFLYLNQGQGVFTEIGLQSGTALDDRGVPNGSMGVAVLDFDGNQQPDIWVTNYENETFALYRNESNANFISVSEAAGITTLGGLYVGFGTVATDLDLDGDEDIVVANGHVLYHPKSRPTRQEAFVMMSHEGNRFIRATFPEGSYFTLPRLGRGLAVGDLDGNERPDLVFSNIEDQAAILANRSSPDADSFGVKLVGTESNRDAIGAELLLETTTGTFFRTVPGGGSYLSQSDYTVSWGIPRGTAIRRLRIRWPRGTEQEIPIYEIPQSIVIVEPSATAGGAITADLPSPLPSP